MLRAIMLIVMCWAEALHGTLPASDSDFRPQRWPSPAGELAGWTVGDPTAAREQIIVLHGGPGFSHHYTRSLAIAFARSGRLVACYDQRGIGDSSSGPLTMADYLADLAAVRQALGQRPTWLVGHSWGAIVAALAAVEQPQGLAGVILIDPMPATRAAWVAANHHFGRRIESLRAQGMLNAGPTTIANWAALDADDRQVLAIMPAYYADPHHPATRTLGGSSANHHILAATHAALGANWDLSPRLAQLTVPALVIHGREDGFGIAMGQSMHAALPTTTTAPLVLIPDAGHLPWVEQPTDVMAAIEPFMTAHQAPP